MSFTTAPEQLCPYCGKLKPSTEFSDEHVVPAALGGNLTPVNPFLLRVCRRCNTACGRHVDGPFIRGWMTSNDRTLHARRFSDPESAPIVPFVYMGYVDELRWMDCDCEVWLGPTGDVAYHFHKPYPRLEENATIVGRPLNARDEEIDAGFVLLMIQASNPAWHKSILLSALNQFQDAPIYLGNGSAPAGQGRLQPLPPELEDLRTRLRNLNAQPHYARISLQIDAGDRFLGKLALGFGALLLGESFVRSATATKLRDFMWGRTAELRAQHEVRGTGFFDHPGEEAKTLLGWPAGHLFWIAALGSSLALNCIFFGSQMGTIEITDSRKQWEGLVPDLGVVYLVCPARQRYFGPVELPSYVASKLEGGTGSPDLRCFIEESSRQVVRPPYHLDGTGGVMLVKGQFVPFISVPGERKELGTFATEAEASRAYDDAVRHYKAET